MAPRRARALLLSTVCLACAPAEATRRPSRAPAGAPASAPEARPAFDARAVWEEFESTLREAYAYLERDDFSVEDQLHHMRALALAARDASALRSSLHRGGFAFTDPHLLIGPLTDDDPNVVPTSADLVIEAHGDALRVADVRLDSPADRAGIRPGWRLVGVDGAPIEQAVERVWGGAVLAKTTRQRAYAATLAANGRRVGTRALEFEVDAARRVVELANPREFAEAVAARERLTVRRDGALGYIRIENRLGDRELIAAFDRALAELHDTRGLVLDLRNTPSGGNTDTARAIIGHFITEIRAYQIHEIPAVERATGVPRRFVEQVVPRAPRYPGRVAVLGGRWTGSMGEGLVIGLHAAAGARTFTSDMGDLLGALHVFELERAPIVLEMGAERLLHVDGTPREDFVADAPLTSADRDARGDDPALTAARAWLSAPG